MIFCPGRAPITMPSISVVLAGPPLSAGGTFLMIIDGELSDLINAHPLNHKMQMAKKRSPVFAFIENFIDTLIFDLYYFYYVSNCAAICFLNQSDSIIQSICFLFYLKV